MTDVKIAVDLVTDAWNDQFDVAIVVSADSDLIPAIEAVRAQFGSDRPLSSTKRVVVAFPPGRRSRQLKAVADAVFDINPIMIKNSQLPLVIPRENKPPLTRPDRWSRRT